MSALCKRIAENETFQTFILALIIITAGCMGLETFPDLADRYESFFFLFFYVSQIIFIAEIAVRLLAYAPRFRDFFQERANTFDFTIVVASCLPAIGPFALVVRLLRVLRLLRVMSVSDRMRGFTGRLSESFDEASYAAVIIGVLGYIFAVAGYSLFSEIAPEQWGGLGRAGLTVLYLLLLQDVPSVIGPLVAYSGFSILFFLLFYFTVFALALAVVNAAITQSVRKKDD